MLNFLILSVVHKVICSTHHESDNVSNYEGFNFDTSFRTLRKKALNDYIPKSDICQKIPKTKLTQKLKQECTKFELLRQNSQSEDGRQDNINFNEKTNGNKNDIDEYLDELLEEHQDFIFENSLESIKDKDIISQLSTTNWKDRFNQFVPSLEPIKEQATRLFVEDENYYEKMPEYLKTVYKSRFYNTLRLFNKYITNYTTTVINEYINYKSLDFEIQNFFFDFIQTDGEKTMIFVFSETKFESFFIKSRWYEFFDSLYFKDIFDFELLLIGEFFAIRKYYKEFPELIILILFYSVYFGTFKNILICLRSLNVLLYHYSMNRDAFPKFKDKIIYFIEKIVVSESYLHICNIEYAREYSIKFNPCNKKHRNNNFYIFLYNIDSQTRSNLLKSKNKCIQTSTTQKKVKLTCRYFLLIILCLIVASFFKNIKKNELGNL